ncbi:MAG: hypothetical protein ACKPKO_50530, partial [Candidatus Fonsibacter sp.]
MNIASAFRRLAHGSAVQGGLDRALWDGLLGPYGAPAAGYTERYDAGPIQGVPAILFADQSKAFERIS